MELELNVIVDAVRFGKKKVIILDVPDDHAVEAAQLTAVLGESIVVKFSIPERFKD